MRTKTLPIVLALALLPAAARAQASVSAGIQINLPVVLPPLVVISPGVQVVQDFDREVFFTGGFYWVRDDGRWYRSPNHRGRWVLVPPPAVPARLVQLPPGHYKRWKPAKTARPAKAERYERYEGGHHDHGRHHDDDRDDHGRGNGHGKHGKR